MYRTKKNISSSHSSPFAQLPYKLIEIYDKLLFCNIIQILTFVSFVAACQAQMAGRPDELPHKLLSLHELSTRGNIQAVLSGIH